MLFPTLNFLIFFLIVLAVAWALVERDQWRKIFLTAASYVFYAFWDWRFTFLLLGNTLAIYLVGLWIGAATKPSGRGNGPPGSASPSCSSCSASSSISSSSSRR